MQWGKDETWLKQIQEESGITPAALLNKPDIEERLLFYYRAFNTISHSRGYSQVGPLPISLQEISAYCSLFEVYDLDQRDTLVRHIQALDDVYIKHVFDKYEKESKAGSNVGTDS